MIRLLRVLAVRRSTQFPVFRARSITQTYQPWSGARSLRHGLRGRDLSSLSNDSSTIYALSTATGRAAIAIVRCSGSACLDIYRALCPGLDSPNPRRANLRTLYGPVGSSLDGQILDSGALVLYFPGPKTVTGEDVIEFHVHGGPAVVKAVLRGISEIGTFKENSVPVARYAEPGEFTRRAFYNNQLDLTQVEALGDTLAAETEQQRQLAVKSTSNKLNERYESWRYLLLQARGELEALIDFSEDQHFEDSPTELTSSVARQVVELQMRIQASIENAVKGELLRDGISIALLGAPNAGKSSLLNRIVGREAAIVSKEAGTTRDVVEVNVDIGGYFCKFGDLAGLRSNNTSTSPLPIGEVETEGIRRAKARALAAEVVVVVLEVEQDKERKGACSVKIPSEVLETLAHCDHTRQMIIFAVNKMDLIPHVGEEVPVLPQVTLPPHLEDTPIFFISCLEATFQAKSIQNLMSGLVTTFASLTEASSIDSNKIDSWDASLGASERQRLLLEQAREHLQQFLDCIRPSSQLDAAEDVDFVLAAESLRAAALKLGRITGRGEGGDVEEVLGVVFEKFCVGK